MQEVPIHQNLLKKTYLASTKSEFYKLDSDEWEKRVVWIVWKVKLVK